MIWLLLVAIFASCASDVRAEENIFRITTGGVAGTYYPVGKVIARAITGLGRAPSCAADAVCGVPGLLGVAQSGNGSVANVKAVVDGRVESGFAQADVAHWAHSATGIFAGSPPMSTLRGIASLYPETLHLLARMDAGIKSPRDLKGKRVSLDEPGSGTIVDARLVLEAYGVSERDFMAQYVKPHIAVEKIIAGELDAYFIVAGHPVESVLRMARHAAVTVVPIEGPEASSLVQHHPIFARDVIPAGIYGNAEPIETISVMALWVVDAQMHEDTVFRVVEALWSKNSRGLLDDGHPKGRLITLETALDGMSIPLHPGARRFYAGAGLVR